MAGEISEKVLVMFCESDDYRLEDKSHLLPLLAHPKNAKVGDFVFVYAGGSGKHVFIDILQIKKIKRYSYEFSDGNAEYSGCLLPPTEHRKKQYLEGLRLSSYPIVGPFRSNGEYPVFPQARKRFPNIAIPETILKSKWLKPFFFEELQSSKNVVGRPELSIEIDEVMRTPSGYVDVRIDVINNSTNIVKIFDYDWYDDGDDFNKRAFSYVGGERFMVFQIEGAEKLKPRCRIYPGQKINYRVTVSNEAPSGKMRLYIPSGIWGGAIYTYTIMIIDVPDK